MFSYRTVTPLFIVVFSVIHSCFALSLTARAPLSSREDIVRARQARIKRDEGVTTDTCASIVNTPLTVRIGGLPDPVTVGLIDACLCETSISNFLATSIVAEAAVTLVGAAQVSATVQSLIEDSPSKEVCQYPAHASPVCTSQNLCHFTCSDGYTPSTPLGQTSPTDCECIAPYSVCNGQCGNFPNGCPSQVPLVKVTKKRRSMSSLCDAGLEVCGAPGSAYGGRGWECVDTTSDLESCGGCTVAAPFALGDPLRGTDCSAIPHVNEVECRKGQCFISSCLSGFSLSTSNTSCVPTTIIPQSTRLDQNRFIDSNEAGYEVRIKARVPTPVIRL